LWEWELRMVELKQKIAELEKEICDMKKQSDGSYEA
jgi:hypothetical protein